MRLIYQEALDRKELNQPDLWNRVFLYVGVYCNYADCELSINYICMYNKVKGVISLSLYAYVSFVHITVFSLFRLGPPSPLHTIQLFIWGLPIMLLLYSHFMVTKGKLTRYVRGINFNLTHYNNSTAETHCISDVNVSPRCCRLAEKSPFLVYCKTDVIGTTMIVCSPISSWISLKSKQMSIS